LTFGVCAYDVSSADLVDIAQAAEAAGFDSLWLGEHVLLPQQYRSAHPTHSGAVDESDTHYPKIVEESTRLLDPLIALAAVAATTTRLRLGTAIYLLPLRHPLLTARAVLTLGEIAAGRFMLGVGAGWLEEEFGALQVPFQERGSRHEEAIEVLRAAFAGGSFEHDGTHFQTGPVQIASAPVRIPIVMGGNSLPALRRAARLGDAWFASGNPSLEDAVDLDRRLEELRIEAGRPEPLECYVRIGEFDPGQVERYVAAGLNNLIFWAQDICPAGADRGPAFASAARRLGIEPPA
jgi:probable F420-dependent oxidoreductase